MLRHPVVAALIGVAVAACGLITELVIIPMLRFGEPLFVYVSGNAPLYAGWLVGSIIAWLIAAVIPIALALRANLKSRRREGRPWLWALFGFGLPASASVGVVFAVGLVTYNTGVIPDYPAEAPWADLGLALIYGGFLALAVALVLTILGMLGRRWGASKANGTAEGVGDS